MNMTVKPDSSRSNSRRKGLGACIRSPVFHAIQISFDGDGVYLKQASHFGEYEDYIVISPAAAVEVARTILMLAGFGSVGIYHQSNGCIDLEDGDLPADIVGAPAR